MCAESMNYVEEIKHYCYTDSGPFRRPFTPNKDWANADVMIIGTNPATPMRDQFDSFDQYWISLTEDPELYWEKYRTVHSGKTSKSTSNVNLLLKLLEPLNILVTNVVWYPSQKKKFIPKDEWHIGVSALTALYQYIQPKVIFCHGADAQDFAKSIDPSSDRYNSAQEQITKSTNSTLVLCFHHFSGQGLIKGTKFQPSIEFPIFAKGIHKHVQT